MSTKSRKKKNDEKYKQQKEIERTEANNIRILKELASRAKEIDAFLAGETLSLYGSYPVHLFIKYIQKRGFHVESAQLMVEAESCTYTITDNKAVLSIWLDYDNHFKEFIVYEGQGRRVYVNREEFQV